MSKTIAAISTPLGRGAISIVRMSGAKSLDIAKRTFNCPAFSKGQILPRTLYLGNFALDDGLSEKCLLVYFKAPYSYTGEDMVEFQVHGGSVITQKVLEKLLQFDVRLAEPGEFSKLAFANGKISLDEAEAIADEINAESESELKAALRVADGKLKKDVKALQASLTEELAKIEATLDYPEEDFEKSAMLSITKRAQEIKTTIDGLLKSAENAKYIEKGISVAIVGRPNVGKSSLLNALTGVDRAIVTEIAGTTRDTVEESTFFDGIKINFIDTAGIRESADTVEKIGIERSKQSIDQADVVLVVLDASEKLTNEDRQILDLTKTKNRIVIINKIDRPRKLEKFDDEVEVSALKRDNVEKIKKLIQDKVIKEKIDYSNVIVTNQRQIAILKESQNILKQILSAKDCTMDIVAMQIKKLWSQLGKITGESENESIIDMIFQKFCLGK